MHLNSAILINSQCFLRCVKRRCIEDYFDLLFEVILKQFITENIIARQCGTKDPSDPQFRMMLVSATDCPLRASVINSAGQMSDALGRGLLQMANGHFLRGLKCICFPAKNRD